MSKPLNILCVPIELVGHVYACISLAQVLIESGHKVMFAISEQWMGKLLKYGIEEILLPEVGRAADDGEDPAKHFAELYVDNGILKPGSTPLENAINVINNLLAGMLNTAVILDKKVERLLETLKVDVIMLDQVATFPSVLKTGLPWVSIFTSNPLFYNDDERAPPANSGLPSVGAENEWKEFRNKLKNETKVLYKKYNEYLNSIGLQRLKPNVRICINDSQWLNIYDFPLELDYTDLRPVPPNWHRFDNFMRSEKQSNFEIPVELREKSGKLIYFSLGSMGGADVALMKRLVAILAKSNHRFIVSKGPFHETYELPDNMWGQQSVPQLQVLSVVDLVITHGGNNTVTETFYFGKPMITMPLFADQFDNAQRIYEKGFGLRLDPYNCSEEELLNGIENLLNDKKLYEKLSKISKRIQTDNSLKKLPKLIEELVQKHID